MDKEEFRKEFDGMVEDAENIAIISHRRPDEDALGSAVATKLVLQESYNIEAEIFFEGDDVSFAFDYIPFTKDVTWADDLAAAVQKFDILIFLDGNEYHRFSSGESFDSLKSKTTICIDHHGTAHDSFESIYVDTTSSSTSQIIFELFGNESFSEEFYKATLIGILGDTGSLRFIRKQNARTLTVVQQLVELGDFDLESMQLELSKISQKDFSDIALLIERTAFIPIEQLDSGMMYIYLSAEEASGVVAAKEFFSYALLRKVEGFRWGFILTGQKDGTFRLSFRSTVGSPNVRVICEQYFKGGGHDLAAGGIFSDETIADAKVAAETVAGIVSQADLEIVE